MLSIYRLSLGGIAQSHVRDIEIIKERKKAKSQTYRSATKKSHLVVEVEWGEFLFPQQRARGTKRNLGSWEDFTANWRLCFSDIYIS